MTEDGAISVHGVDVTAMVATWPAHFRTDRATALGLAPDGSFDDVVRASIDDLR